MISILIAEDEHLARERLVKMLTPYSDISVIGIATNGAEAFEKIQKMSPQAVFLDIKMPCLSGLELAKKLALLKSPPLVVFSTAYDGYAVAAFDLDAVDYLLKPYRKERLDLAINRLRRAIKKESTEADGKFLLQKYNSSVLKINLQDVTYLKAEDKYITAHTCNGQHIIDGTLSFYESHFSDHLLRINRNILVNTEHVSGMHSHNGKKYLRIKNSNDLLPVSRRNISSVKQLFHSE